MTNYLIILLGPTGVGKTDVSVYLASLLNCDIISADSRQFFREMNIGTAVPSDQQLKAVRHHFVKFMSVETYYSSSLYERDVINILPDLFASNNMVLMTGGSGLYIDAVCNGIDDIPDVNPMIRDKYISLYNTEGVEGLRAALKMLDPEHYSKVDLKNHKRIMRALEICDSTGRPYSSFLLKQRRVRDFGVIKIGLERDRNELYVRINSRVDEMIKAGLEEEARALYRYRKTNALNCVGYREFFDFFEGKISRDKAIELIKQNSRRYAKRQMTWWARDKEINWFHPDKRDEILSFVRKSAGSALA